MHYKRPKEGANSKSHFLIRPLAEKLQQHLQPKQT